MEPTPNAPPIESVACALLGFTLFAAWLALQLCAWRSNPLGELSTSLVATIALGTTLSVAIAAAGVFGPAKTRDVSRLDNVAKNAPIPALPEATEPTDAPPTPVLAESRPAGQPDVPVSAAPVYSGPKNRNAIALVFDDGPHPEHTEAILDVLDDAGAKASFAVLGKNVERHPEIVRRTVDAGHQIVSHGWSHARFTVLDAEALREELESTATALARVVVPPVNYVRPPYGATSDSVNQAIADDHGARVLLWSIDPRDWESPPSEQTAAAVILQAVPGAIVVLHDTKENTVEATRQILQSLGGRFDFVTIDELMRDSGELP